MFFKLTSFTIALAVATSALAQTCSTGSAQCCQQTGKASDPSIANLLGVLGIVAQGVDALVGVDCSPISVSTDFWWL